MIDDILSVRQRAVARWLADQGKREEASIEELAELHTLFAPHKGFGIFWSLIAFDKAQAQLMLNNINLGTPEADAEASRLQGQIRAIDAIYDLLLQIADPPGATQQEPADGEGVRNNG